MPALHSPLQHRISAVVMGVSGSGKSTVAAGVADALGLHFVDGDGLHSAASVAKMQAGTPLQDDDRWPWLDRVGESLADADRWPQGVVVACSALKRAYRDRIRRVAPGVRFLFLDGPAGLIRSRMSGRTGHYMPAALLDSQLQALERPAADETDVIRLDIDAHADEIVDRAARALGRAA
jgi:gluconokinase